MAQEGFDELMALTDSRYRLSMITARRAAQLKAGIPPLLEREDYPKTRNTVSIAMKELELGADIRWGDDLPATEELRRVLMLDQREESPSYSVSRQAREDEEDLRPGEMIEDTEGEPEDEAEPLSEDEDEE